MLIAEYGLDKSTLRASGRHGTLLKGDVLDAIKSGKHSKVSSTRVQEPSKPQSHPSESSPTQLSVKTSPVDSFQDFPNTQIRKVPAVKVFCVEFLSICLLF